jgi:hypothetical protein
MLLFMMILRVYLLSPGDTLSDSLIADLIFKS